jgi:hypothetical protein
MNKLVDCFEITVSDSGLTVNDLSTNQVSVIETTFPTPYLLFTDGTLVRFCIETKSLSVYRRGPCYIWSDNKTLLFGKTHGDFLISDKPNSLRGKSWD